METRALRELLEAYYDAAPRSGADVEDFGALTLFVARGAWPYYARPTLGAKAPPTAADIERVRARQREKRLPEAFEWVHETTPAMLGVAREAGLLVREVPLMVLEAFSPAPESEGVSLRLVGPDDPDLAGALAVALLGFSAPGTALGAAGIAEREQKIGHLSLSEYEHWRSRLRSGLTRMVIATGFGEESGPIAVGSHIPVNSVSEIVGVATLPAMRRRGLARRVTAKLVEDARSLDTKTIFLSAGDEDVARMYASVGFVRIGTACIAEPPAA